MRERCPICHRPWQFTHTHHEKELLGHFCEVAHRYVFWDNREVFFLPNEEFYRNPPLMGGE